MRAETGQQMKAAAIFEAIERAALGLIVVLTVAAIGLEVKNIVVMRTVVIADILLLFLYTEVISMAGAFYRSRRIPVVYPPLIAITALSRLIVLQSKDMDPQSTLYEAGAVLILGLAVVALHYADRMNPAKPVSELDDGVFDEDATRSNDR